jgi:glycosyltransferase involved in cell wall biosynthesis
MNVSVVVAAFNQARYLPEAIESVISQQDGELEVVVVDDGSTDETPRIIDRYPVRGVHQRNQGLASARNAGLRASVGAYVVFLDADDRLIHGGLEAQKALLNRHSEWAFVSGEHRYISEQGAVTAEWSGPGVQAGHFAAMLRKNYIGCCSAVMFRRSVLESLGGFDPRYRVCEDYDLYLRILERFEVGTHERVVAEYRRYATSMSGAPDRMLAGALRALQAHRKATLGRPELEAAFRSGQEFWRGYYGEPLARRTAMDLWGFGDRTRVPAALWCLARWAPLYLGHAVKRPVDAA